VLEISSAMDIGEQPASCRGRVFAFTNADCVRLYKNGRHIRDYTHADSPYPHLPFPPIEIDDLIGSQIEEDEDFTPTQARYVKDLLNYSTRFGTAHMPPEILAKAAVLMTRYGMTFEQAYALSGKYNSNWGGAAAEYRFDAVRDGRVVRSVTKTTVDRPVLRVQASHTALTEGATYDVSLVRIAMTDGRGGVLPFWQGPVLLETDGPIALIGPKYATMRGGLGGTFVKTTGTGGRASLTLSAEGAESVTVEFTVTTADEGGRE